jgi:transcriptional regulator GlxA family with amidase domain
MTAKIPIRDQSGKVIGLAGITRDLSRASKTMHRYGDMAPVMQHLEAHYAAPISVTELAALVHLSVSQFERRFKSLFQTTPAQYLVRFRLNKASQLLATSATKITEIALQCGFYDHSHFIRQFTRAYGLSPSAYRRRHQ